jgi:signal peptidase I
MFALILTLLSALTGLVWLLDKFWLGPRRRRALAPGVADQPGAFVEFCISFFPVIFAVLMVRSFLVEPFRIPSGSMIPTLHVGDFILVNKFGYGLRCPVGSCKFVDIGEPKRGDVVVFKYPARTPDDPNAGNDFVKRVIGLPGDHITYQNKVLSINGQPVTLTPGGTYFEGGPRELMHEDLGGVKHDIILNDAHPADNFEFDVPPGQYFMMGDNRDGSYDSRYWGTVPEADLKGRAMLVWMSWDADRWRIVFSRIGTVIH